MGWYKTHTVGAPLAYVVETLATGHSVSINLGRGAGLVKMVPPNPPGLKAVKRNELISFLVDCWGPVHSVCVCMCVVCACVSIPRDPGGSLDPLLWAVEGDLLRPPMGCGSWSKDESAQVADQLCL